MTYHANNKSRLKLYGKLCIYAVDINMYGTKRKIRKWNAYVNSEGYDQNPGMV